MTEHQESQLVGREACPKCGSSDNLARYSDGHAYCFGAGCGYYEPPEGEARTSTKDDAPISEDLLPGSVMPLSKRRLTADTCALFGYIIGRFNNQPVQIAPYRNTSGHIVAQKLRFADKDEGMPWLGEKKNPTLFGSHLWGRGKRIVITEGEIDAMTVSQVQNNKWPVVSVPSGAAGAAKAIAHNLEYLSNFDEIVLMFDMDEPGRLAADEVANVLMGKRVLIASLPLKDPSEMLQAGRGGEIVNAIWQAKPYAPASVLYGEEILRRLKSRPKVTSFAFPDWMPMFTQKVLGIRLAELDVWTSGSGMGKTTLIKQLQVHYWRTTPFNQAIIHLEEPLEDTAESLVGVHLEKRLTLPEVAEAVPEAVVDKAAHELFMAMDESGENHRFYLHDAFGSMGSDEDLMNRIRYYALAKNCKIIWLDHLSILVSSMGVEGDERRRIDALMHSLKSLTIELGIYIGLISHIRKAGGNGPSFEEGAVPSLDDLRGSGGIKQLANSVYAISRNQQADTEMARNTARLHVLKSRYTGDTGNADFIFFNKLTGTFEPGSDPEDQGRFSDESDEFAADLAGISKDRDDIPF
jgi:twinkle protein